MTRESFESEWTQLGRRLRARLERRRVPAWLIDDVLQETGLKLFQMWPEVDAGRSPWGLTITIANNLLWEEMNRRGGREIPSEIPERPTTEDVEEVGLARIELARVYRNLGQMSASHRDVLLAEVGAASPDTVTSKDALKMRRMRARRQLNSMLEKVSASCGALLLELKSAGRRTIDGVRRWGETIPVPAQAAACFFAAGVILGAPVDILASEPPEDTARTFSADEPLQPVSYLEETSARGATRIASTTAQKASSDPSSESDAPASTQAAVEFGDDEAPARGGAGFSIFQDEEWEPSAPECEVEPANDGASVHCWADTPAGDVEAGGGFHIDP